MSLSIISFFGLAVPKLCNLCLLDAVYIPSEYGCACNIVFVVVLSQPLSCTQGPGHLLMHASMWHGSE